MLKQIEIVLTILCLLLSAVFITLIILRIRGVYLKKYLRISIWNSKVNILTKSAKLIMAISLFLGVSGVIYFIFYSSPHLRLVKVYYKIALCIFFGLWSLLEVIMCFSVSQKLLNGSIFKRIVFFLAVLICAIGAAYLFPPLARSMLYTESLKSTHQVIFPETPSGRCASDYFKAFNSGDSQQMQTFIKNYRSESYIEANSMQKLIESYKFMYMVGGTLTPIKIIQISDYEIIVFLQTTKKDRLTKTHFKVDNEEPNNLLVYTITPTTPEEALQITKIDQQIVNSSIDSLIVILRENYVDPEKGKIMADSLKSYKASGRYSEITDGSVLSLRLTNDLWPLCHDKHLSVTYGKISKEDNTPATEIDSANNYGFHSIEVLENNIGYIRFDEFNGTNEGKKAASRAFNAVSKCDAIIFDLRYNTGGSPKLVNFLYSYLFSEPTYVGSLYNRITNDTIDFWTHTDIPGKPIGADIALYILTSSNTFSAAEEFAYFLRDMKRAIVIGETTGGGAHQVDHISVNDYFGIRIPFARMISPVSKTDWEGIGVIPDIKTSRDEALEIAVKYAINDLKMERSGNRENE